MSSFHYYLKLKNNNKKKHTHTHIIVCINIQYRLDYNAWCILLTKSDLPDIPKHVEVWISLKVHVSKTSPKNKMLV